MHEVSSSAVSAIGYSGRTRELHVRFKHGAVTYVYANVPFFLVGAIFKSHSKGRALHRHVLGKVEFTKEEFSDGQGSRA